MPKVRKPYQPRAHISPVIRPILTADQVREIRKIFRMADKLRKAAGKTRARPGLMIDLAKKYGVSRRTIQHLRTGDRWSTLK